MLPLYSDDHFTFRFLDDRIIPRFHLDGIEPLRIVTIHRIDSFGHRTGTPINATVGDAGWVELLEPIIVRSGEGFDVFPDSR